MRLPRVSFHARGRHHRPKGLSGPVQEASSGIRYMGSETVVPRSSLQMADMTTHRMLDDVDLDIEAAHLTPDVYAIAGYVNGEYANWPAIVMKYGNTGRFLLSIDVQAYPASGAQCLDVERFDAEISQAPGWFRVTQAAGKAGRDLRWYPKLYVSEGDAQALVNEMTRAGIGRIEYLLWTAHYDSDQGEHICGPKTCGCPVQADATQWTSRFQGASLDASLCYSYFFAGPGAPVGYSEPRPPAAPKALAESDWSTGVILASGAKGDAVKVLQIMLRNSGIEGVRGITADGNFGLQTLTALRNFQSHERLTVDGIAGPKTHAALTALNDFNGAAAPRAAEAPVSAPKAPGVAPAPVATPKAPAPPSVLLYAQRTIDATLAAKLQLPVGTIIYIPQIVQVPS